MTKTLIILNDGTDEIFNLHTESELIDKEKVGLEIQRWFGQSPDEKYYLLVESNIPDIIEKMVEYQNSKCEIIFPQEKFISWKELKL